MKILATGYCGRSHSILLKLLDDPRIEKIYWAPGNAGLVSSRVENVPIAADDGPRLAAFAQENGVGFTIVSQNFAIYNAVVDSFKEAGLKVFGPTKDMAALEWNKIWAKDFFVENSIPSPAFHLVNGKENILQTAERVDVPVVVKYGGLAQGGGVFVCFSRTEVREAAGKIVSKQLSTVSGSEDAVLFEQYVTGKEVSMHFIVDGEKSTFIGDARDYKRSHDGDTGLNTAGMGSYTPSGHVNRAVVAEVTKKIIEPTIAGMKKIGRPYRGILYAGVMLTEDGPMLLEYNCRFGDSECQALMGRLDANLLDLFMAEDLSDVEVRFIDQACVTVCMCTRDYPEPTEKQEHPIEGLDLVDPEITVYHYGTLRAGDRILTPTGRVLSVTATGPSPRAVHGRLYQNIRKIHWEGVRYRSDVGLMP